MLEQFQPVFDKSPFGVYLYLDDVHKICNDKMVRMLGVKPQEWHWYSLCSGFPYLSIGLRSLGGGRNLGCGGNDLGGVTSKGAPTGAQAEYKNH
jgi:hypothetical protein